MFARLFGPDDDQLLVTIENDTQEDEAKLLFKKVVNGMLITPGITLKSTQEADSWEVAESILMEMDEEKANSMFRELIKKIDPHNRFGLLT